MEYELEEYEKKSPKASSIESRILEGPFNDYTPIPKNRVSLIYKPYPIPEDVDFLDETESAKFYTDVLETMSNLLTKELKAFKKYEELYNKRESILREAEIEPDYEDDDYDPHNDKHLPLTYGSYSRYIREKEKILKKYGDSMSKLFTKLYKAERALKVFENDNSFLITRPAYHTLRSTINEHVEKGNEKLDHPLSRNELNSMTNRRVAETMSRYSSRQLLEDHKKEYDRRRILDAIKKEHNLNTSRAMGGSYQGSRLLGIPKRSIKTKTRSLHAKTKVSKVQKTRKIRNFRSLHVKTKVSKVCKTRKVRKDKGVKRVPRKA